jgi:hypothetical protein
MAGVHYDVEGGTVELQIVDYQVELYVKGNFGNAFVYLSADEAIDMAGVLADKAQGIKFLAKHNER